MATKTKPLPKEALEAIARRQAAAKAWADEYFPLKKHPRSASLRALIVLVGTAETRDYLAENDPMALKQAQEALSKKSYIDYLV